jgi:hypothetical protein
VTRVAFFPWPTVGTRVGGDRLSHCHPAPQQLRQTGDVEGNSASLVLRQHLRLQRLRPRCPWNTCRRAPTRWRHGRYSRQGSCRLATAAEKLRGGWFAMATLSAQLGRAERRLCGGSAGLRGGSARNLDHGIHDPRLRGNGTGLGHVRPSTGMTVGLGRNDRIF